MGLFKKKKVETKETPKPVEGLKMEDIEKMTEVPGKDPKENRILNIQKSK